MHTVLQRPAEQGLFFALSLGAVRGHREGLSGSVVMPKRLYKPPTEVVHKAQQLPVYGCKGTSRTVVQGSLPNYKAGMFVNSFFANPCLLPRIFVQNPHLLCV